MEAKAEMGGLCKERCEEDRRGAKLEVEDRRKRRVEKNSRCGGEKVAGNTSPLIKGKRGREREVKYVSYCFATNASTERRGEIWSL